MSEPELSTATATTEEPIAPAPSRNRLGVWGVIRWTGTNMSALWLLIAEIVIFTLLPATSATFPHVQIAQSVLDDVAVGALVAVGLIVPLAAGVFDLSVGYMVAAGSIVYSWIAVHSSLPPFVAILAVLGLSLVVAALNSMATVVLRIHSFIGTLAIGSILLAAIEYVTGNQDILNIPNRYVSLFGAPMLGETRGVYVVLGICIVIWWLTSLSNIGPRLYATGFNVDAARLAGVAVSKQMVLGFFVSAICAGSAGIVLVGNIDSGSPTVGPSYLLSGFAAAFLGSTQIIRGRFNVWGTLLAVVALGVGTQGLALAGASFWAADLFNGVALLAAVGLSARVQRARVRAGDVGRSA
jgi:ribose transport system permease protein